MAGNKASRSTDLLLAIKVLIASTISMLDARQLAHRRLQLDWLISMTAMIVLSWSRATRDLLKSFGWGIGALHQLATATMVPFPRRLPHSISLLEGNGFELPVP